MPTASLITGRFFKLIDHASRLGWPLAKLKESSEQSAEGGQFAKLNPLISTDI